jgi:hypothetical protein
MGSSLGKEYQLLASAISTSAFRPGKLDAKL